MASIGFEPEDADRMADMEYLDSIFGGEEVNEPQPAQEIPGDDALIMDESDPLEEGGAGEAWKHNPTTAPFAGDAEQEAVETFLTQLYSTKESTTRRYLRVFDQKVRQAIEKRGSDDNLFIIYEFKDIQHPSSPAKVQVFKYNPVDYGYMRQMIMDPKRAWDAYYEGSKEIQSDLPALLSGENQIWVPWAAAVYDPLNPEWRYGTTEEEKELVNNLFIRERARRSAHVGRFMKYGLDMKKFEESQSPAAVFLKNIKNKDFFEKELQIPWFTKLNDPLKEENEGEEPIQNPIYSVPCMLYALMGQISQECYDELVRSQKITARGVKLTQVTPILLKYGYDLAVYTVRKQNGLIKIEKKLRRSKNKSVTNIASVMFWEEHWMKYLTINVGKRSVCIIKLFEMLKEDGLLYPYNTFEMAEKFNCFSFDSMLGWKPKEVQKILKKNFQDKMEFTSENFDLPEYKEPKEPPRVVFFADFEATTDEKYHVPFMICGRGYYTRDGDIVDKNIIEIHGRSDGFIITWGTDCALKFLETLVKNVHCTNIKQKGRRTISARIYFFNLKYDITFILPYLREVDKIEKEGRIYSVTGIFMYHGSRYCFDFWDAYPIFQSTLAAAGRNYLTEEEKKTIKKEAFPYRTYTYQFMGEHFDREKAVANLLDFEKDPNYEAFKETVEKDLEDTGKKTMETDQRYTIESDLAIKHVEETVFEDDVVDGDTNTHTKTTVTTEEILVKWMDYAEFYCCQDVKILAGIMNNMKNLMKAEGCEGIHGVPPFSQNVFKYRTASSLSYDYFLKTVIFDKTEDGWISKHHVVFPKALLRYLIQLTVRGGRVMCRDNEKWHYVATGCDDYLQDYDAVSLYPSAMSRLWISEGIPKFLNGEHDDGDFMKMFCGPEDDENKEKKPYTDGCIHITWLYTRKARHFPLLCIKDEKSGLNEYKNYVGEVDTWVNAIDLYNLIDFQDAQFKWDMAVAWDGPRFYEIRSSIKNLFEFRKENHGKGREHPIQNVAKIMMNSIYGKSVLKASDKKKITLDIFNYRKEGVTPEGKPIWRKYNQWLEWFKANMYRIHSFEPCAGDKVNVTVYCRDMSHSFNIFGSNVLAMARRIIGRVMALGEDLEEKFPQFSPGIFYTDTDSMHIRQDLLRELVQAYKEKYGEEIMGSELCQFHIDFDAPKNYKKGEFVRGASESYFIAKKMYADQLEGSQGSVGHHLRMKGIPAGIVEYSHYPRIFNGEIVEFNLLEGNRVSFFYENGNVGCRPAMSRAIGTKEAKKQKREGEIEEKRAKRQKRDPQPSDDVTDDVIII